MNAIRFSDLTRTRSQRMTLVVLAVAASAAVLVLAYAWRDLAETPARPARLSSPLATGLGKLSGGQPSLRLAIAPVVTPPRDFAAWLELARWLEPRLGRRVDVLRRRTCPEAVEALLTDRADAAVLCAGLYLRLDDAGQVARVALPRAADGVARQAALIVRTAEPATDWRALRGRSLALVDPVPGSGRLYIDWLLASEGLTLDGFFPRPLYTYGHDASVYAVARGLVDAAVVDAIIWRRLEATDPAVAGRTRVLEASPPLAPVPLVARASLDARLRADLEKALVAMDEDEAGRDILRRLGLDGFDPGATSVDYGTCRRMLEATAP